MVLRGAQLKPGMIIYFNETGKKDNVKKYKKAIVKDIYKHFVNVEVLPVAEAGTNSYITSLSFVSIGCGDVIIKDCINANELATELDVAIEEAS